VGDAGDAEVDPLPLERHPLGPEPLPLLLSHRQRTVGADDPPPGQPVGDLAGGEQTRREPRRPRRDVAIGAYEPLRDVPDRGDDLGVAVVGDA
jgi:hypothetical protein